MKRKLQPWRCPNGHILGMIQVDEKPSPKQKNLLMLYGHAVDENAEKPADVEVVALLVGGLKSVQCDVCMIVGEWHEDLQPYARRKVEVRHGKSRTG